MGAASISATRDRMKRRSFFGWLGASVATPLAAKAVSTAHDMSLPVEPVAVKPQPLPVHGDAGLYCSFPSYVDAPLKRWDEGPFRDYEADE